MADMGEIIRGAFARAAEAFHGLFETRGDESEGQASTDALSSAVGITNLSSLLPYLAYDTEDRLFLLDAPIDEKRDDAEARERKRKDPVEAFGYSIEIHPQTGASQDLVDLYQTLFFERAGRCSSFHRRPVRFADIEPYLIAYERDCVTPEAAVARSSRTPTAKGLARRVYCRRLIARCSSRTSCPMRASAPRHACRRWLPTWPTRRACCKP